MSIFRALGFIILILAIKTILPEVFHSGETLVLTFLGFLNGTVSLAGDALSQTASIIDSVQ